MTNVDILNGKPFKDSNLAAKLARVDEDTASVTTIAYSTFANPSTTERTLIETTSQITGQKLYSTIDAMVNLTSNITGNQDFTFKLYLGATVVATSVVTIPDAINTLVSVRLVGSIMYSRTNGTNLEYLGNLVATPLATSATASVSTLTTVHTQSPLVTYATLAGDFDTKLTCTASVGTATTTITAIGGRTSFDNKN